MRIPSATALAVSDFLSAFEPVHQWILAGLQRLAISLTHANTFAFLISPFALISIDLNRTRCPVIAGYAVLKHQTCRTVGNTARCPPFRVSLSRRHAKAWTPYTQRPPFFSLSSHRRRGPG